MSKKINQSFSAAAKAAPKKISLLLTILSSCAGYGCSYAHSAGINSPPGTHQELENRELENKIRMHQAEYRKILANSLTDPHGGLKYLNKDEYVLPNNVLQAFWKAYSLKAGYEINGLYISGGNPPAKAAAQAQENLQHLRLTEEEQNIYLGYFTLPKVIFYNRDIFSALRVQQRNDDITERIFLYASTIMHERTHKYLDLGITPNGEEILKKAYQEITARNYPLTDKGIEEAVLDNVPKHILKEAYDQRMMCTVFPLEQDCANYQIKFIKLDMPSAGYNPLKYEEFYPNLVAGEFSDYIEKNIRKDYPEAYRIIINMKNYAKLEVQIESRN